MWYSFCWKSIYKVSQVPSDIADCYIQWLLKLLKPFPFLSDNIRRKLIFHPDELLESRLFSHVLVSIPRYRCLRYKSIIEFFCCSFLARGLIIGNGRNISKRIKVLLLPLINTCDKLWPLILWLLDLYLLFEFLQTKESRLNAVVLKLILKFLDFLFLVFNNNLCVVLSHSNHGILRQPVFLQLLNLHDSQWISQWGTQELLVFLPIVDLVFFRNRSEIWFFPHLNRFTSACHFNLFMLRVIIFNFANKSNF